MVTDTDIKNGFYSKIMQITYCPTELNKPNK